MALRLGWHNIHILYQFGLPYHNHSDAFYYLRYGLPWKNFWMNIIFLSFSFEPYIHSDLTKTMNWMNTYYSKTETHRKSIIAAAWRVQQHEVNFEQVHFRFLILWPVHLSASITSRMYMCSSLLGGDEAHFRFAVAPNAIFCTSLLPSPLSLRAHTVILCTVQVNGLDSGRIFIRYRKNTVYTWFALFFFLCLDPITTKFKCYSSSPCLYAYARVAFWTGQFKLSRSRICQKLLF